MKRKTLIVSLKITSLVATSFLASFGAVSLAMVYLPSSPSSEPVAQVVAQPPEPTPPRQVHHDPTLLSTLQYIQPKGGYDSLSLRWTSDPLADCGSELASGCHTSNEGDYTIFVRNGFDMNLATNLVAHEYLHYIWYRYNLGKDQALVDSLHKLYANTPSLQRRIPSIYTVDGKELPPTEIFSYACADIDDGLLGSIAVECNKYINTQLVPVIH